METSVIIRTFNEQRRLPALFDALGRQLYRDFETIVVDSGSIDKTREIAGSRATSVIRINSHDFTYGYSLNAGIKMARGRFIVIVSAHAIPVDEHWLGNLIAPLQEPNTAMAYGRQIGMNCSKFSEAEDFERLFGERPRLETPSHFAVNNANSAILKELWRQYPFNEELLGLEDIDWARRWMGKGWLVTYQPKAAVHHIHEETWGQIRRRSYREAVAFCAMGLKSQSFVPKELAKEALLTLSDFYKAAGPGSNPVKERLTVGQRLREIVYYRANKNIGAIKGLLDAHPLETSEARERILFDRTAEAVVIRGPRQASLEELEIPEIKPGEALIRVAHVAVCATDLEIFNGTLGFYKNGVASYPIVPGHEFSGRVVAIGQNVVNLTEQDPVVVECIQSCLVCEECLAGNFIGCHERAELGVLGRNGAYARYVAAPARFVHKLPAGIDLCKAALCEPLAVTLKGLRRLGSALGSGPRQCLVIGAGPLGHMFAKVLLLLGHQVTIFDCNKKRLALLDGTGIKPVYSLDELARFSVIIEVTGDPEVLFTALHQSRANASLLLLGLPYGKKAFSFEAVAAYDKTVIGSVGSTARDFEDAIKMLDKLDLSPYLQCQMPLKEFNAAWKKSQSGEVLKVILNLED